MTEGRSPRAQRPWYRPAVLLYDALYRRLYGLEDPTSEVGPALRIEIRRSRRARRLPDGTVVRPGDRVGFLHLKNDRLAALHRGGRSPVSVGLEFRRQIIASLEVLATLAKPGGPFADVRAFAAITVFHRGLARVGFQAERGPLFAPTVVGAYQRALLASIHPAGLRLRRPAYARARRVWMSREAVLARFGDAGSHAGAS